MKKNPNASFVVKKTGQIMDSFAKNSVKRSLNPFFIYEPKMPKNLQEKCEQNNK